MWRSLLKFLVPRTCLLPCAAELRIAEYVNQMVPWDEKQCKVSPGTLVVALVINILVNHVPLYRLEAFYKNLDLPLLFDEDVSAEDLNDDALARALDKLSLIDKPRLIHTVACRGIAVEDMQVDFVHADTTSLSVQESMIATTVTTEKSNISR